MKWFLALCLAVACFDASASAGWGGGSCGPVGPCATTSVAAVYEWRKRSDDPGRDYLYTNRVQVGGWDRDGCFYRPYNAGAATWGDKCEPPVSPPSPRVKNFGVDTSKLCKKHGECFSVNGKSVSKREFVAAIGDIPADKDKMRLTLIGPEADRKRVQTDLGSAGPLAEFKGQFVLQSYTADHWAVEDVGFKLDGKPTIYLQSPDGKVLLRVDAYEGPEDLAGKLRRANPLYDPDKDPSGISLPGFPDLSKLIAKVPAWGWVVIAAGVFLWMRKV
jgi:hypothetical protein